MGKRQILPDPSTVARIAELLNTTADYLLGLYRPVSNVSAPEERFFGSYSESLIPVIGTVKAGYGALAFEGRLRAGVCPREGSLQLFLSGGAR